MGANKYQKFNFVVEKQISIKETPNIKKLALNNVYVYTIRESLHNFGFIYISSKKLSINTRLLGKQLEFYKTDFNEETNLKLIETITNQKIVQMSNTKNDDLKINKNEIEFSIVLRTLFYKKLLSEVDEDKKQENFLTKEAIHTKRIAVDKYLWFIEEVTNLKNPQKKLLKETINGAVIDNKIKNILISELINFKSNKYIHLESHSIVLTQGGTGKSSILGIIGKNLDDTSNAGIFGSYDVKRSQWNAGLVSQTDHPILVDETNEMIASGKSILDTLNKPLDNGTYYYGKAGARNIEFGNQFIFLGNISDEFNFERFIQGLSNNVLTIGRRFAYVIYDTRLEFKNGGNRPKKRTDFINTFSELLSYCFYVLMDIKDYVSLINSKAYIKRAEELRKYIKEKTRHIEHIGTQHFYNEYIKSLDGRIPFLVLKLVVFENLRYILDHNIIDTPKYYIADKFHKKSIEVLEDIKETFDNIEKHQRGMEITNDAEIILKQKLNHFTKSSNYILELLCENSNNFYRNKLFHPIKEGNSDLKQKIREIIQNCKKYPNSIIKINENITQMGIKLIYTTEEVYFTILNQSLFKKICVFYEKEDIKIDKCEKIEMKTEKKEDIDILDEIGIDL